MLDNEAPEGRAAVLRLAFRQWSPNATAPIGPGLQGLVPEVSDAAATLALAAAQRQFDAQACSGVLTRKEISVDGQPESFVAMCGHPRGFVATKHYGDVNITVTVSSDDRRRLSLVQISQSQLTRRDR